MRDGYIWLSCLICLTVRWLAWSLKPRMTADIVTDALTMAWFRKKPAAGLMHHSDRGSQYACQQRISEKAQEIRHDRITPTPPSTYIPSTMLQPKFLC